MAKQRKSQNSQETHWDRSAKWYDSLVGKEGHYYHKQVILPKLIPLLGLSPSSSLLDLGCGQGILARALPGHIRYLGIDLSHKLLQAASKGSGENHSFLLADICEPLPIKKEVFTHVAIVLALQNVSHPEIALENAALHLPPGGKLVLVLNHPCFRIPRQSHWGQDTEKKIQYRRMDRYLSPLKVPIQTHPGKADSPTTFSFHLPLSDYTFLLAKAGFHICLMEEWISDKESTGPFASAENRARKEFPLFLAIKAEKRYI